jgi:hypothetical protein
VRLRMKLMAGINANGADSNMEHLSVRPAAALLSATLPDASVRDAGARFAWETRSDEIDQLAPQSSLGLSGRQLYSKEQWDAQKPIIWRLYNQENMPFKRVIEILRNEYNFVPTYVFSFLSRHDSRLCVVCSDRW